jgi:hypothetical protein
MELSATMSPFSILATRASTTALCFVGLALIAATAQATGKPACELGPQQAHVAALESRLKQREKMVELLKHTHELHLEQPDTASFRALRSYHLAARNRDVPLVLKRQGELSLEVRELGSRALWLNRNGVLEEVSGDGFHEVGIPDVAAFHGAVEERLRAALDVSENKPLDPAQLLALAAQHTARATAELQALREHPDLQLLRSHFEEVTRRVTPRSAGLLLSANPELPLYLTSQELLVLRQEGSAETKRLANLHDFHAAGFRAHAIDAKLAALIANAAGHPELATVETVEQARALLRRQLADVVAVERTVLGLKAAHRLIQVLRNYRNVVDRDIVVANLDGAPFLSMTKLHAVPELAVNRGAGFPQFPATMADLWRLGWTTPAATDEGLLAAIGMLKVEDITLP